MIRPFKRMPGPEPLYSCNPPCSCWECRDSFYMEEEQKTAEFSYRFRFDDNEARILCKKYTEQAEADRARISFRLAAHADVVMSQWRKRSQEKREALLRAAAPDMSDTPWTIPLCSFPGRRSIEDRTSTLRYRRLLPWLNMEVLKKNPAVLYALLHYRTIYPPQSWAAFDSKKLTNSWATGLLDVDHSSKCVVMHGTRYGDLATWEEAAAHRGDILGFPRACLVLEAQALLLATLCRIVDRLLENTDDSQPVRNEKWKDLTTSAAFKFTGEIEFWFPYTNPAFSMPPPEVLNIEHLLSLTTTRLEATADHLWDLQFSNASMRRFCKQVIQNHVFRKLKPDPELLAARIAAEVFNDVLSHYRWRWLGMECRHIQGLHQRFRDKICPGHPLPPEYDRALGGLEILVVHHVIFRANALSQVYPYSPGLSHHYVVSSMPGMGGKEVRIQQIWPKPPQNPIEDDPLAWVLLQLQEHPDNQTHYDHAELFSLLQHHLAANASFKEKSRVDERMYSMLSDLMTCHEILSSIRLCRPRNRNSNTDDFLKEDREGWKSIRNGKMGEQVLISCKDLERAGMKLMPHFHQATAHGAVTRDSLLRSRKASQALEEFWTSMRRILRNELLQGRRSAFSQNDIDSMMAVVSAHSTNEYLNAARAEAEALLNMSQDSQQPARPTLFPSDAGKLGPKPHYVSQARKNKVKSRPQPDGAANMASAEAELAPEPAPDVGTPIRATPRVMNIVHLMYPQTAAESSKSVKWEEFVYAMRDVGFTERNNGGSAVLFEKNDGGGKIVLHRPHPVAMIDPVMLHSMGRRMTKWFGWVRERFMYE
ncbi:hypothetical protein F4808DRAFT_407057 [Astrocystis sublimbata]|nr:hypothetical protein F4808DRAFT_407057 [Astrocystis sublimbata]